MTALADQKTNFGSPTWVPIRSKSIANQIVMQVRDALFAGDLKPGDALGSEKKLADSFGVSRITVRDALRILETMGIVEIRVGAGGGTRIAHGNIDYFSDALAVQLKLAGIAPREMLDAQIVIESAAADMAANNRTQFDLRRLKALLHEARAVQDNPEEFTRSGHRFHLAIAEASGNRALVAQFKAMRHIVWPRNAARATREIAGQAAHIHGQLYELIKKRDAAGARELMRVHLESIRDAGFSGVAEEADQPAVCC